MKPTGDDFQPRKDGWFGHRATWGEVVVGTVVADPALRTPRWEVIDTRMDVPVEYGHTLWMRVRDQVSGQEHSLAPLRKNRPVVILTQDPADTKTGDITPPSNSDAVHLIVQELGAKVIASRDETTGEITCPEDLSAGDELVDHLQFAHGFVSGSKTWKDLVTLHGREHNPKYSSGGGFPHRHVPEDLSII